MAERVKIIGGGLAGSEAALDLAHRGIKVTLVEMRPVVQTPVHKTGDFAELVCSNSLKSMSPASAAGMLKYELEVLESPVYQAALATTVPAGGALGVNREEFAGLVSQMVEDNRNITIERREAQDIPAEAEGFDALILATGPLTSDSLATSLQSLIGSEFLAFYDAAAPIVAADSLDFDKVFSQSRYEEGDGDYLNAPMSREEYEDFIEQLVAAERVILKDFETKDLFQACQPIEEIARKGIDAPRYGTMKPVGLTDPNTGRRPWAAVQLRAENREKTAYNLVGFQTNLTFAEQARVFRMIPGLENAEFLRYGVMHRNTFIPAPGMLDARLRLHVPLAEDLPCPVFVAGQLSGTEGYVEAIRSGAHAAISVQGELEGIEAPSLPAETAFGALIAYATDPNTKDYQPSHVTLGLLPPLETRIRDKKKRNETYAARGRKAMDAYAAELASSGLLEAGDE